MKWPGFSLSARWSAGLGLAAVLLLFCVPLFIGLDAWDQRNDEAIYSFSVDRILETGEWLTPRSIPIDDAFLEKPPLKYWIVAGAMRLGLIPFDDWGMRFPDAVLCTLSFVYIYLLGRRLAGTFGGIVSVFVLFSFDPLIFAHGIRGNNMEGALLLAYCGGIYHFHRWTDQSTPRRRAHALAVSGYFVLAFMTKFVAAVFLPIVAVAALGVRPSGRRQLVTEWRSWLVPAFVALLCIAPWFIYQTIHSGRAVWDVMFLTHVYTRFTGTLVASHIHPWHHYFTQAWFEFGLRDMLPIAVSGVLALAFRAWGQRNPLAQLLFLWWIVPCVLISLGTSKLFYYAYPFIPPLGIGAGLASAMILDWFNGPQLRALLVRFGLKGLRTDTKDAWRSRRLGQVLAVIGVLAVVIAAWTLISGPITLQFGGVRWFRSSSPLRAVSLAVVLLYFAGLGRAVLWVTGVAVLTLVLPVSTYEARVALFSQIDHPLRTTRDCALDVENSKEFVGKGLYDPSGDLHHGFYYYLRRLGPWTWPENANAADLKAHLELPGTQTIVTLTAADYVHFGGILPPDAVEALKTNPVPVSAIAAATHLDGEVPPGILIGDSVVVLFPGPFGKCIRPVVHANARRLPYVAKP